MRFGSAPWLWLALLAGCAARSPAHKAQDNGGATPAVPASDPAADGGGARAGPFSSGAGGSPGSSGHPAPAGRSGNTETSAGQRDAGLASDPANTPLSCPASDVIDGTGMHDTFVANSGKQAVTALTYTNVGATGAYAQVVSGWSKATGCVGDSDGSLCKNDYRKAKQVSGPLAPFDEELSMVFAGPTELYQVAVFTPAGQDWQRVAYWDRCVTEGLAFTGNKSWYECGGFVESYVSADGSAESDAPVQFAGHVAAGTEIHITSDAPCSSNAADSDCGWSSGLALHGFAGSKIFVTEFRMPIDTKTPAYWILPSQVLRSSQYGCNCRGQGSDPTYKGGCGELDIAEILGGVTTSLEATTTLYSFQDITGGGSVAFERPVNDAAVFVVMFDLSGRQIAIRRLAPDASLFSRTLAADVIAGWLAEPATVRALQ
jgi:hypothetical protein